MIATTLGKQYSSMKSSTAIVFSSRTLRGISVVCFFYELGMSGISSVSLYYLKAVFGFNMNQFSEILMVAGVGSVASQLVMLPLKNLLIGEKAVLCIRVTRVNGLCWAEQTGICMRIAAWFLSSDAPINCNGFSIVCASLFIIISLCCACKLMSENSSQSQPMDESETIEAPLLA